MIKDDVIMGPYQFQKRNKADPNEEWIDINFAKVHWALRPHHHDPLLLMNLMVSDGVEISTPYTLYRAVRKEG